jgi:DtxR family Mn-dependent transcriptional regulator
MSDLIDTTEMYLKVVFELEEQNQPALRARLAERLGQAMPSVSQTVGRLERDGLLHLADNRVVELTTEGRRLAVAVMRKHRVAERFLFDVLGLDWADCHDEACRWEHVLGDAAEVKLAGLLADLTVDPYGNPIPGLDVLGRTSATTIRGVPVSEWPTEAEATLVAIGEGVQADGELLHDCAGAGIIPGARVTVHHGAATTTVTGATGDVRFDSHLAAQLFVAN